MASLPGSTQVLVVGGGPAGSSTAWHLAKLGLDVCVIDRASFPRAKACAEYLSPEGARVLHEMGALREIELLIDKPSTNGLESSCAAALTGMEVHAPSGEVIRGEFIASHGFRGFRDRGIGVRRELLDKLLLDRVRTTSATVVEQAKIEAIHQDHNGAVVGARIRTVDGLKDIRTGMIIGADGLRSTVSRRLGLAHTSRWPRRYALTTHFSGVGGMSSMGEMHVTRDGYLGIAPVGGDVVNVALVVSSASAVAMRGNTEKFLLHWIGRHSLLSSRFEDATRVSAIKAVGPFASRAKRAWARGAMLVGDAADFFDPFTGEGIYAALKGGELVAPFAQEALHFLNAKSLRRAELALRAYGASRRESFTGKWRVEKIVGAAVSMPTLMNYAARVLGRDKELADLLVGVTGDFVPPSAILSARNILRMLGASSSSNNDRLPVLHAGRQ